MPLTFEQASGLFSRDAITELADTADGLRFLKLRSLSRANQIAGLLENRRIESDRPTSAAMLKAAYNFGGLHADAIDDYIRNKFVEERAIRRAAEPSLIVELYKSYNQKSWMADI
jgi:hypothetical protein